MNSWWSPRSWWNPANVRNFKAYIMHVFFSTEGRISVGTWLFPWILLTIIWGYFLISYGENVDRTVEYEFMRDCTGMGDEWIHSHNIDVCEDRWYSEVEGPYWYRFIVVWLLLLYPYTAISVKRFHDIHGTYGATSLFYCIVCSIIWGLGALIYIGYMLGGESQGPNRHGKSSLMSFRTIWNYESNEIKTAVKWENNLGFKEAINIYKNLSKFGEVKRVEAEHIAYLKKDFREKLSFLKKKGIDCTGLEISVNHLGLGNNDSL